MDEKRIWRFPTVKGGQASGLTTGDKETFKKNPYGSLAREILQNSIDVATSDDEPVLVEFSSFVMKTSSLPDLQGLKDQINRCISFWSHKEDYCATYRKMLKILDQDEICCLRISDFNTSGLRGVSSNILEGNRFIALVKGSGVSEKDSENAGGSKGVGKNAAIEQSFLDLIFYSTITDKEEVGTIGVANFVSGLSKEFGEDRSVFTQGAGYYSDNENNMAIKEIISFDKNYDRKNRKGTDILIIGFKGENEKWEKEVITSVIDSFLVAIFREKLCVNVNGLEINKESLYNIVNSTEFITDKNIRNTSICSLRILSGDNVQVFDIETDYGTPVLYVLPLTKKEEELSTHSCAMIRHPFMKIKSYSQNKNYRVAAMCVIDNGNLCKFLRKMENPEHTEWQANRLDREVKAEGKALLTSIQQQIAEKIQIALQIDSDSSIDPNKAGEFLPSIDTGDNNTTSNNEGNGNEVEESCTTVMKENKSYSNKAIEDTYESNSLEPDIGAIEDGGDIPHPIGNNNESGGEPHAGSGTGEAKEGDNIILRNVDKSPIKYKFVVLNKEEGIYKIVFTSPINRNNCYLNLRIIDDANNKENIEIASFNINGKEVYSDNPIRYGPFAIETNKKEIIVIKTSVQKGLFGSEVRIICK